MTHELIELAKKYPGHHPHQWLKDLYSYWKDKPVAKTWCGWIEESGILET
ncbi:hypothetical protein LCGC14_0572110 [marine sediment metagenome]|uniref:Uncharacterized protein n=1 Tax=marine sediment metagenome TaxID=412755 RepID=A0A0F9US23_9ZZZZ